MPTLPAAKIESRAYLRFVVEDRPGVVAVIARALGERKISIESMLQHAQDLNGERVASLIILTHAAPTEALEDAVREIEEASFIRGKTVRLGVRG